MSVVERYVHASASANLKCDQYHFDADVLMAIAMSAGLAGNMVRVKYRNDAAAYRPLLRAWRSVVRYKARLREWPTQANPAAVAKISLDYWLDDQCRPCNGTGFPMLRGIPTRGAKACPSCDGSGRRPLTCPRQFRDPALDMYDELCDIFGRALIRAGRKLRG